MPTTTARPVDNSKLADYESGGDYSSDQIERYVLVDGQLYTVIDASDDDGTVTVTACWSDGETSSLPDADNRAWTLPLIECQPACAHCCEPLYESDNTAPGECHNR